jgi:hypothetical protein
VQSLLLQEVCADFVPATLSPDNSSAISFISCSIIARSVSGGYAIPQSIQVSKEGYQAQTIGVQRGFRTSSLILDIFPGVRGIHPAHPRTKIQYRMPLSLEEGRKLLHSLHD